MILPDNRDFVEIALNRQADRDCNERQNEYITAMSKENSFEATIVNVREACTERVMQLMAVTLSLIVLNK